MRPLRLDENSLAAVCPGGPPRLRTPRTDEAELISPAGQADLSQASSEPLRCNSHLPAGYRMQRSVQAVLTLLPTMRSLSRRLPSIGEGQSTCSVGLGEVNAVTTRRPVTQVQRSFCDWDDADAKVSSGSCGQLLQQELPQAHDGPCYYASPRSLSGFQRICACRADHRQVHKQ